MIYVPYDNINDYKCYTLYDKDTIRAYISTPQFNTSSNYTDYFINSHYVFREGVQTWGNYSTLPICLSTDNLTNEIYYRNDFSDILIIFVIIAIIGVYLPFKIFSRAFGRWFKI